MHKAPKLFLGYPMRKPSHIVKSSNTVTHIVKDLLPCTVCSTLTSGSLATKKSAFLGNRYPKLTTQSFDVCQFVQDTKYGADPLSWSFGEADGSTELDGTHTMFPAAILSGPGRPWPEEGCLLLGTPGFIILLHSDNNLFTKMVFKGVDCEVIGL